MARDTHSLHCSCLLVVSFLGYWFLPMNLVILKTDDNADKYSMLETAGSISFYSIGPE